MTPKTRFILPVIVLAALAALLAGCSGATTTVRGAALSSPGPSSSAPAPATSASPARSVTAVPASGAATGTGATSGPVVYLAEGGFAGGTLVHAPACTAGCALSGDSTTWLYNMTWATWNSVAAAGTGTEKLDDCTPNCAAGTLHAVPVKVTLSKPVMVCVSGRGKWLWTRVSFTWPAGLPAAFSGANAPLNPFNYPDITAQAAKACA
jgi:hypothetical protein